jgi:hypothetical protein
MDSLDARHPPETADVEGRLVSGDQIMKKLVEGLVAASLFAGAVAFASPVALADGMAGFTHQGDTMDPILDETGYSLFRVNVAFAGNTPAAVRHFYAGLTGAQRHSIDVGCREVLSDGAYAVNTTVTMFCRNLRSAG